MALVADTRRFLQGTGAVAATGVGRLLGAGAQRGVAIVVFSRDRALQLDLLLETYAAHVDAPPPLIVLYRATTDGHRAAYVDVLKRHAHVVAKAKLEGDFRADLLTLLGQREARNLVFLVDDLVFIRPLAGRVLRDWPSHEGILSLRLGGNISSSYNAGIDVLPQPATLHAAERLGEPMLRWRWRSGALDWQLALSLDGHVMPKALVERLIERSSFRAPNSLEAALGRFRFVFRRGWGYAYPTSRVVNLPLNSVKAEDFTFPTLGGDANALLQHHLGGCKLDVSALPLQRQTSCHLPWTPALVRRTGAAATHRHVA